MFLMIDNYDSFVYNLVRYFEELGEQIQIYHNDKIDITKIDINKYKGIVISPGPKSPKESGKCLKIIERFKGKIPILGICLGHQCLGYYFGNNIIKGDRPYHGKLSLVYHNGDNLFVGIKNPLRVTRYHSLVIEPDIQKLKKNGISVDAKTEDGTIMAISSSKYKIFGVQFHPEAYMTEQGHQILGNFIKYCNNSYCNKKED